MHAYKGLLIEVHHNTNEFLAACKTMGTVTAREVTSLLPCWVLRGKPLTLSPCAPVSVLLSRFHCYSSCCCCSSCSAPAV